VVSALEARISQTTIGRFRYIALVKCPYRVAGKASAFRVGQRGRVECPYRVAGKASVLGAGSDIPISAYSNLRRSIEVERLMAAGADVNTARQVRRCRVTLRVWSM